MALPNQDAVEMFMSITGASEGVAAQTLQVHSGDLNAAVNSYFSEGDRRTPLNMHETSVAGRDDFMDIDHPVHVDSWRPPPSLVSEAREIMNPFSIINSIVRGRLFDRSFGFTSRSQISTPREVREIPIEFKDDKLQSSQSGLAPRIEDVTGTSDAYSSDVKGMVELVDDDDNSDKPLLQAKSRGEGSGGSYRERLGIAGAPEFDQYQDYGNDIEEEMIRAAIEASRRDAEAGFTTKQSGTQNDSSETGTQDQGFYFEDPELAHVVALSLKTAEQEKELCEKGGGVEESKEGSSSLANEVGMRKIGAINERSEGHTSIWNEAEDLEEKPLLRHESKTASSRTNRPANEVVNSDLSPSASPREQDTRNSSQHNGKAFPSDEWGGISLEEHEEAVMLEAAMFGGIPEGKRYHFARAPHQFMRNDDSYLQPFPRVPSPSVLAQRIIREHQDDEYLAALQADREKELKVMEEAETRRKEERQKEEESRIKLEEQQVTELERQLAARQASLPAEPSLDDENAVTLLVRMPDGSRRGCRFLKHNKLQCLFDFIDISRFVKPGSYRLVRPYPRRAFSDDESALTLTELGLTSKQEALFLELI